MTIHQIPPDTSNGSNGTPSTANGHHKLSLDELDELSKVEIPEHPQRKLLHASELKHLPPSEWLIEGVLPTNKLTELFGMPGHGKSFTNLDIALSVAQFANVVYIAAEDAEDYESRVAGWCEHHKVDPGGLHFWPEAVNLFNQACIDAFLAEVESIGPALIVVDPLVNCMVGGDESSTKDMTIAVDRLNYIRRQTQAAILVCHHTGWNDAHERGSSVLRGACRVVMKLNNTDGLLTLTCEKINGGKAFDPRYFQLVPVADSVVPVPTSKITQRDAPINQKQIDILEALHMSIFVHGATFTQLVEHLNFAKSTMNRSLTKLKDHGYITQEGRGAVQRYKITDSGADVLLADESEAAHASSTTFTISGTRAELTLNWNIKTEVIRSMQVPQKAMLESASSAQFHISSAVVPPAGSRSVPHLTLKGVEQRNPEQNANRGAS